MKKSFYTKKGILACIFAAIVLVTALVILFLISQPIVPGTSSLSTEHPDPTIHSNFDGTYSARIEHNDRLFTSLGTYGTEGNNILLADTEDQTIEFIAYSFNTIDGTIKGASGEFVCISSIVIFTILLVIACGAILAFTLSIQLAYKEQERLG